MREVDITLGDVRDLDALREVARGAHAIFHLAALIGIPYSYEHPQEVIDTNVMGTSNVLLAAKESRHWSALSLPRPAKSMGRRYVFRSTKNTPYKPSRRTARRRSRRMRSDSALTAPLACQ